MAVNSGAYVQWGAPVNLDYSTVATYSWTPTWNVAVNKMREVLLSYGFTNVSITSQQFGLQVTCRTSFGYASEDDIGNNIGAAANVAGFKLTGQAVTIALPGAAQTASGGNTPGAIIQQIMGANANTLANTAPPPSNNQSWLDKLSAQLRLDKSTLVLGMVAIGIVLIAGRD